MKRSFNTSRFYQDIALAVFDIINISFSLHLAVSVKFQQSLFAYFQEYTGATVFIYSSYLLFFYLFNFYDPKIYVTKKETAFLTLISAGCALFLIAMLSFMSTNWKVSRLVFLLQALLTAGFMVLLRRPFSVLLSRKFLKQRTKVLLIGAGKPAAMTRELLEEEFKNDFEIVGNVVEKASDSRKASILGTYKDIRSLVDKKKIDLVVSCVSQEERNALLKDLFYVKMRGAEVTEMPVLYSALTKKIPIEYVSDDWFVYKPFFGGLRNTPFGNFSRFFDLFFSILLFVLSLPFWLFCYAGIKLTMPGPALFFQTRLGMNKKPYRIIKFRSMKVDAETKSGPVWSRGDSDSRITAFGRFMRRTRLDELPQLINVIKGEMSLIGPRPERPYFVEKLSKTIPYYDLRFSVRPGLTGWAQVNYKYADDEKSSSEKLQYDLYYIQENSLVLNMKILVKTLQTVMTRPGM